MQRVVSQVETAHKRRQHEERVLMVSPAGHVAHASSSASIFLYLATCVRIHPRVQVARPAPFCAQCCAQAWASLSISQQTTLDAVTLLCTGPLLVPLEKCRHVIKKHVCAAGSHTTWQVYYDGTHKTAAAVLAPHARSDEHQQRRCGNLHVLVNPACHATYTRSHTMAAGGRPNRAFAQA